MQEYQAEILVVNIGRGKSFDTHGGMTPVASLGTYIRHWQAAAPRPIRQYREGCTVERLSSHMLSAVITMCIHVYVY